jgi:hypothetical protein
MPSQKSQCFIFSFNFIGFITYFCNPVMKFSFHTFFKKRSPSIILQKKQCSMMVVQHKFLAIKYKSDLQFQIYLFHEIFFNQCNYMYLPLLPFISSCALCLAHHPAPHTAWMAISNGCRGNFRNSGVGSRWFAAPPLREMRERHLSRSNKSIKAVFVHFFVLLTIFPASKAFPFALYDAESFH